MCFADSPALAALAALVPRFHRAFVCVCTGAFLSTLGAALRDFFFELDLGFWRYPVLHFQVRAMPCRGRVSATTRASSAAATVSFCVFGVVSA